MSDQKKTKDQFDPENLRISQDFAEMAGVKKEIVRVPVRKPNRQEFCRVNPDEKMRVVTAVLELHEEREPYLVSRSLWSEIPGEISPRALYTAINRYGDVFLWPVKLPGEDGRTNPWHESMHKAVSMAEKQWVRIAANMMLGAYDVYTASGDIGEPEWPDRNLAQLLEIAFKERFIDSPDHAALKRLRGEI